MLCGPQRGGWPTVQRVRTGAMTKWAVVLALATGVGAWAQTQDQTGGFCEYTVDGAAPQRGGGGPANIMSIHWMDATQPGRQVATPLLINCGPAGAQLNFDTVGKSTPDDVRLGPAKYPVGGKPKAGAFGVRGRDFFGSGEGELVISAWDTKHVAGSFTFTAKGKRYAGRFDLKCPYKNRICR